MTEDDYIDIQSMLRACDFYFSDGTKSVIPELAADFIEKSVARIEKLEAALRHCINALREYEMGDDRPRGPIPNDDLRPWLLGAMDNARKALEEDDD